MRLVGGGLESLRTFCGVMDFPRPIQNATFTKIQAISQLSIEDLDENMLYDESDVTNTPDEIVACKQEICRRGHRSYNGVFTILGQESGKIIDLEVLSSYCLQCNQYEKVHGSEAYGTHVTISKKDCCGHVQKRFGTQRTNLKENKKLGGKGKLTDKIINTLQTYYGNAIRAHPDSIEDITRAIWAIFYHKASTDQNPQHMQCPPRSDSWCKYQKAVAEELNIKPGKNELFAAVTKDQARIKDAEKQAKCNTTEARKLRRLLRISTVDDRAHYKQFNRVI
ncbi:hypothetical protein TSAR_000652 [Trichomalopsis sarcophagae]|uniref:Mutator-like transposase domain-containing protein n=1 Tax=Trichomalopsis sarcophagae TaxID=543379 RepID=A0A232F6T3_9HYME|nr:hypothetical protein TSAR_000652 [Trichomalopsis sarcophagae]